MKLIYTFSVGRYGDGVLAESPTSWMKQEVDWGMEKYPQYREPGSLNPQMTDFLPKEHTYSKSHISYEIMESIIFKQAQLSYLSLRLFI